MRITIEMDTEDTFDKEALSVVIQAYDFRAAMEELAEQIERLEKEHKRGE